MALGTLPLFGAVRGDERLMRVAPRGALVQFLLVAVAFGLLAWSFVTQDFSVEYVARNSNSLLPMHYRISAVWGAHEGSLLLWMLILSGWTLAVAIFSRSLPAAFRARVLAVLGWVSFGFLLFILYTSNPFSRLDPVPVEGMDLNPLLQDPGLIIHPPMLYMGYVGFSVAFAFAVAALLGGQVDRNWVRWSRPWTSVAWSFLTLGIALGSWWAYYELGWGGWWFWDPVENASFMPWLVGTALIHSQAVTEKRGAFRNWTLMLAIAAFSLSLLGTFLVRSGILTSVHAFASDPTRGVFILAYLVLVVGGSLLLFALRAPRMERGEPFAGMSRETLLLVNNLVLAVMAAVVLAGTLYPLALDALGGGKISVGPPYFGTVFSLLMIPLIVAMPIGFMSYWKQDRFYALLRRVIPPLGAGVAGALIAAITLPGAGVLGTAACAGAGWIILASVRYYLRGVDANRWPPLSVAGMTLAHLGVAAFLIGVGLSGTISSEKHLRMAPGDSHTLAGYRFRFEGTRVVEGPNYMADRGTFQVFEEEGSERIAVMEPEKRRYLQGGQVMTEAAIDAGLSRDLYVSLGEPLDERGTAWAVRLYHKPFVRFIWLGALMMMAGGFLAAADRRYRASGRLDS
ncbi:MAG: heme lyase CcmF/NrfE family subunit [Xanthomonadales bacterium]|nr:heme lyase CcmF/NrfE family subunit [Xanthomonadales bacterium]